MPEFGVEVDMTAHPFSTGLTELIPQIVSLKPGDKHPLIDRQAFLKQLEALSANARVEIERGRRGDGRKEERRRKGRER